MTTTESKEPAKIDFSVMGRAELEQYALDKTNRVIALEAENSHFKELFRKNQRNAFGSSSERYISEGQLCLFNEAEKEAETGSEEPGKSEALPPPKKKKGKGHKKGLVAHLPKEIIEYTLTGDGLVCPRCGGELEGMGTVVRTEIEVIPETYKVVEHRSKAYSCRACDKEGTEGTIVTAPSPNGMFRNSLASPSMAADISFKKYALAQPLYRQAQELSRKGLDINRNTLANWVIKGALEYLMPVKEHMKGILVKGGVVQADETSVQVLHEPGKAATAKSYMWAYRSGRHEERQIILFDYSPGRAAEYPKAFLGEYKGYLLCDGYQVYRVVAQGDGAEPAGIIISACWDHARRRWTDIIKGLAKNVTVKGTDTEKALEYIGELYKIEEKVRGKPPEERLKYREEYAAPIMDKYFKWLKTIRDECTESLRAAVDYSLNLEKELRVYLKDGRLDNSNCLCENAIRPFCVGRRNWLFSDTQNGAEASAACYGIIETAKANGIDPFEYLKYIFAVFKDSDIGSLNLDDFMPWSPSLPDACRKHEKKEGLAS